MKAVTMFPCRFVSLAIAAPVGAVYRFASNPANLPRWASGLSAGIREENGAWVADSPMGPVTVRFVAENTLGVLDHEVTLPGGETFYNPMRVQANGAGSEVVFTLYRRPEMSAAEFETDARTIAQDLATLKAVLEREGAGGKG